MVAVSLEVYALTGSSLHVGLLGAFALVPLVLTGLYGGSIADAHDRIDPQGELPITIVCECAMDRCDEKIQLPVVAFEALREESIRFAVVDGHVLHDIEQAVEQHVGWMVVEKIGDAARGAADRLS